MIIDKYTKLGFGNVIVFTLENTFMITILIYLTYDIYIYVNALSLVTYPDNQ